MCLDLIIMLIKKQKLIGGTIAYKYKLFLSFILQGSYRKIHSKFTNFSQTFAIWGKKATQRYATLPHIW